MKIVSQIDESTFVVRMEEHDLDEQQHVFVAHDYFSVSQKRYISASPNVRLYGKFVSCNNVAIQNQCHISIRPMIELVMPYLMKHPNMQISHLFEKDGSEAYNYSSVNIVLHGDESYIKNEGEKPYFEREVLEYKSVFKKPFSYEKYYDVNRKVYRYGLKDDDENSVKEEHFTQNHTSIN